MFAFVTIRFTKAFPIVSDWKQPYDQQKEMKKYIGIYICWKYTIVIILYYIYISESIYADTQNNRL